MSDYSPSAMTPTSWYRHPRFPLVPEFRYRAEDKFNISDWCVSWLMFRAWTMMSPELGVEVRIDDQDLVFRLRVPYLFIHVAVPIFPRSLYQRLWRVKRSPHPQTEGPCLPTDWGITEEDLP